MSEAICDHIVHVVVILRIVTEKHIILSMIQVKGNVLQTLCISQPISDIGNLTSYVY